MSGGEKVLSCAPRFLRPIHEVMTKEKFELEYIINASNKIIYSKISTPSGLAEWFSDDVHIRGDIFTFFWEGSEEKARLVSTRRDEFTKFRWMELEEEGDKSFFEMRIKIDALTKELAIIVTDFAEEDELDDAKLLWDSQIDKLKHLLGC